MVLSERKSLFEYLVEGLLIFDCLMLMLAIFFLESKLRCSSPALLLFYILETSVDAKILEDKR